MSPHPSCFFFLFLSANRVFLGFFSLVSSIFQFYPAPPVAPIVAAAAVGAVAGAGAATVAKSDEVGGTGNLAFLLGIEIAKQKTKE